MNPEYDNLSIKDKIEARMDMLQMQMESNLHLTDPNTVKGNLLAVSKFWAVLTEEDKDYIQAAQHAIEDMTAWNV